MGDLLPLFSIKDDVSTLSWSITEPVTMEAHGLGQSEGITDPEWILRKQRENFDE